MQLNFNAELSTNVLIFHIQEAVKEIYSYYYKYDGEAKVVKASFSLSQDMEKLNQSVSDVPLIIVARSHNIRTENRGQLNFAKKDELELQDPRDVDNKIFLSGHWFEYETDIQIIIMAKTTLGIIELQTELKRILNTSLKEQSYPLVVGKKDDETVLYRCNDYGSIGLYGFEEAPFETQEVEGIKAVYIQGIAREHYFKLKETTSLEKLEVKFNPDLIDDKNKYP